MVDTVQIDTTNAKAAHRPDEGPMHCLLCFNTPRLLGARGHDPKHHKGKVNLVPCPDTGCYICSYIANRKSFWSVGLPMFEKKKDLGFRGPNPGCLGEKSPTF